MSITQKYKQQQQQVRIQTSEENYINGMSYTDAPLAEGQSRVLVNWDIDTTTGKLVTRKGLQTKTRYSDTNPAWNTIIGNKNKDDKYVPNIVAVKEVTQTVSERRNATQDPVVPRQYNVTQLLNIISNTGSFASVYPYYLNVKTVTENKNLTKSANTPKLYFKAPKKHIRNAIVHNRELCEDYIFQIPGTFYMDRFYSLGYDNPSSNADVRVARTIYNEQPSTQDAQPYELELMEPKEPSIAESVSYGFNMLRSNPFELADTLGTASGEVLIQSIVAYSGTQKETPTSTTYVVDPNSIVLDNKYSGTIYLKAYVLGKNSLNSADYTFVWEYKTLTDANWTELKTVNGGGALDSVSGYRLAATFTRSGSEVWLVRLTIKKTFNTNTWVVSSAFITIDPAANDTEYNKNLTLKNYDLCTAKKMCTWKQRFVIWGVADAPNMIFISDLDDPTYFPYPNNTDVFDDNVLGCYVYGDSLIVLTSKALYLMSWADDGIHWTKRLIQQNLNITEIDAHIACVIKNMFFFKSNEYYYMLVPSATVAGTTTIAPISKPITELLDNFHTEVFKICKTMYATENLTDFTQDFVNYHSYISGDQVVVNYVYRYTRRDGLAFPTNSTLTDEEKAQMSYNYMTSYIYVQLIYDTSIRAWSICIFEAPNILHIANIDAIKQLEFVTTYTNCIIFTETASYDASKFYLQKVSFKNDVDSVTHCMSAFIEDSGYVFSNIHQPVTPNYQLLDTGNRNINTDMKKRFREFQFKIKNPNGANVLGFYTGFYIDGSLRRDIQRYETSTQQTKDGEYVVIVNTTLDPENMTWIVPSVVEKVTISSKMLQDAGEMHPTNISSDGYVDASTWTVDLSAFPGRTLWKIRMAISGKGMSPRAILLSKNEKALEILGQNWVYRTQNSR